jgi:hypothetical protein
MIARNKYFNKTVGAAWQFGEDIYHIPRDVRQKYDETRTKVRNTKAGFHRWRRRRRDRKKRK